MIKKMLPILTKRLCVGLFLPCLIYCLAGLSCTRSKNNAEQAENNAEQAEYESLNPRLHELNSVYFTGTIYQARESLLREEDLLKHTKSKGLSSAGLTLTYARLYALEMFEDNTNSALSYLGKYKSMLRLDLERQKFSPAEIAAIMERVSSTNLVQAILKWDKGARGIEPNYRKQVQSVR